MLRFGKTVETKKKKEFYDAKKKKKKKWKIKIRDANVNNVVISKLI